MNPAAWVERHGPSGALLSSAVSGPWVRGRGRRAS